MWLLAVGYWLFAQAVCSLLLLLLFLVLKGRDYMSKKLQQGRCKVELQFNRSIKTTTHFEYITRRYKGKTLRLNTDARSITVQRIPRRIAHRSVFTVHRKEESLTVHGSRVTDHRKRESIKPVTGDGSQVTSDHRSLFTDH